MRRRAIAVAAVVAATCGWAPAAHAAPVKAGVASVDATWHVGASAGQYASDGTFIGDDGIDPTVHSYRRATSYGVQSRLQVRALVVQGSNGKRMALVKNDFYIPQDLIYRRAAQILEAGDSGISAENLTMAVTHNHNSPFYASTSWGVWTFQDVYDIRFFDYYAKRMALAVERAAAHMVPVRVGGSVSYFDKTHRHSYGGTIADDGTPAGYPDGDSDHDLSVVRFDDVSNPGHPKPLAILVNWGLHPESLEGNDLISEDYLAPLERIVDRRTKAMMVFTQGSVGTAEPERSKWHSIHERLEFSHKEYAQTEYNASLTANVLVDTWRDIERGTPENPDRFAPFKTEFDVAFEDGWFPGPLSHPYPGVSSCRTDAGLHGDPRIPVAGLPDCVGTFQGPHALADFLGFPEPPTPETSPIDPGLSTDDFEAAGIPLPENYSAPAYTGLEEDVSVHMQAFKLGDILFTVCSCEQFADQSRNIETRTNARQGDQYFGYDWTSGSESAPDYLKPVDRPRCERKPNGTWTCPDPGGISDALAAGKDIPTVENIPDADIKRMRAQVLNDAKGWNDPSYLPYAESEPADTTKIKGNYTHEELPSSRAYKLTVPMSMGNDYNGYIVPYREYQRGDHYRKALTAWGPHASDYFATNLVRMAGHMNGGPAVPPELGQEKVAADLALNDQRASVLGQAGDTSVKAYEAALPDDGGKPEGTRQPKDLQRFAATFFSWVGGSNFTDTPQVRVQRRVNGQWEDYYDQSGEIQLTLKFPQGEDIPSYLNGDQKWVWTAHFEAFGAPFNIGRPRATPPSSYRFLVTGKRREGGKIVSYKVISRTFKVSPWDGIEVQDIRLGKRSGRVSFALGPRHTYKVERFPEKDQKPEDVEKLPKLEAEIGPIDYPDSYKSPARFIKDERSFDRDPMAPNDVSKLEWFCLTCTFRPWADAADAKKAYVTFVDPDGDRHRVRAKKARGGRWVATRRVCRGQSALVRVKQVRDSFGDYNGVASATVTGSRRACASQRKTKRRRARFRAAPRFTG